MDRRNILWVSVIAAIFPSWLAFGTEAPQVAAPAENRESGEVSVYQRIVRLFNSINAAMDNVANVIDRDRLIDFMTSLEGDFQKIIDEKNRIASMLKVENSDVYKIRDAGSNLLQQMEKCSNRLSDSAALLRQFSSEVEAKVIADKFSNAFNGKQVWVRKVSSLREDAPQADRAKLADYASKTAEALGSARDSVATTVRKLRGLG